MFLAVYNHWTGLVGWTGGLDWWTDTKNLACPLVLHAWMLMHAYMHLCNPLSKNSDLPVWERPSLAPIIPGTPLPCHVFAWCL